MSGKPRRWFQIHLSTALILMLVVAVLLFLNMRGIWPGERENGLVSWLPQEIRNVPTWWEYGWPMKAYGYVPYYSGGADGFRLRLEWTPAALDGAVALFAIAAVWISCEAFIRRREAWIK